MKDVTIINLRKEEFKNLIKRVSELKRELMNLRFQRSSGQLESSKSLIIIRREIARLKTVLTEKNTKKIKKI